MTSRHPLHNILAVLLAFATIWPASSVFAQDAAVKWEQAATDFELGLVALNSGIYQAEITLARTSLNALRIEVLRASDYGSKRSSVQRLCSVSHALLCINANFFDEDGDALGLVVHRGIQVQGIHQGGKTLTGIFQASRDGIGITSRSHYRPERVLEAVQSGPRILLGGQPVPGVEQKSHSRRSGLCIDKAGRLLIYTVSSGLLGVSMEELQGLLRAPGIECQDALNLDGGGSSQIFISQNFPGAARDLKEISVQGRDEVPVALGLFPR